MKVGRWKVRRCDHGSNAHMDRFGGGWRWKLGVQVGGSRKTVIVNLIWRAYRFDRDRT